jgi:hypothetical protein
VVFLDPIETGGCLVTLENNGATNAYNYGVYIGTRYKNFPNIVWLYGNDFQNWGTSTDNNLVKQVMAGIASVDPNHLQTIELNYNASYSNQIVPTATAKLFSRKPSRAGKSWFGGCLGGSRLVWVNAPRCSLCRCIRNSRERSVLRSSALAARVPFPSRVENSPSLAHTIAD